MMFTLLFLSAFGGIRAPLIGCMYTLFTMLCVFAWVLPLVVEGAFFFFVFFLVLLVVVVCNLRILRLVWVPARKFSNSIYRF
jgi:hypothetical protein